MTFSAVPLSALNNQGNAYSGMLANALLSIPALLLINRAVYQVECILKYASDIFNSFY